MGSYFVRALTLHQCQEIHLDSLCVILLSDRQANKPHKSHDKSVNRCDKAFLHSLIHNFGLEEAKLSVSAAVFRSHEDAFKETQIPIFFLIYLEGP